MSDIAVPGQLKLSFQHTPGPLANPVVVPIPQNGGMTILVSGGLTKIQQAGLALLPALLPDDTNDIGAVDHAILKSMAIGGRFVGLTEASPEPEESSPESTLIATP